MVEWNEKRLGMLAEGVRICFSKWTALQLAVQNEWGGRNSAQKMQQLVQNVVDFMTQSKEMRYIDDLEDLLDEALLVSFNTEIDDGSIEEVAEIVLHLVEECSVGDYHRVQQMSGLPSGVQASVSRDQEEGDDNDNDNEDGKEEQALTSSTAEAMNIESSNENKATQGLSAEDIADGWQVVLPRGKGKGKGKRHAK